MEIQLRSADGILDSKASILNAPHIPRIGEKIRFGYLDWRVTNVITETSPEEFFPRRDQPLRHSVRQVILEVEQWG